MHQSYPALDVPPVYTILNTNQFDQWNAIFTHGVRALEGQLSLLHAGQPCSKARVFAASEALLNTARLLSAFLHTIESMQPQTTNPAARARQQVENIWLKSAITDLRICCHRYSLAVFQIAHAMEKRIATNKCNQAIKTVQGCRHQNGDNAVTQNPKTTANTPLDDPPYSATSTCTRASAQSWWSHNPLTSSDPSEGTFDSDHDSDGSDDAWLARGCATTCKGFVSNQWSPLSDSCKEYLSHW